MRNKWKGGAGGGETTTRPSIARMPLEYRIERSVFRLIPVVCDGGVSRLPRLIPRTAARDVLRKAARREERRVPRAGMKSRRRAERRFEVDKFANGLFIRFILARDTRAPKLSSDNAHLRARARIHFGIFYRVRFYRARAYFAIDFAGVHTRVSKEGGKEGHDNRDAQMTASP